MCDSQFYKSAEHYHYINYITAEHNKKVARLSARRCKARKMIASGKYTVDDYDDEWFLKNRRKNTPLWKKLAKKDPTIIAPPPEFA